MKYLSLNIFYLSQFLLLSASAINFSMLSFHCEFPRATNSCFAFDISVLIRLCSIVYHFKGNHMGQMKAWSSVYALIYE